jgi:allantoinase
MLQRNFNLESALNHLAEWLSTAPARLAGLHTKGAIRPGADADFAVFYPEAEGPVTEVGLHFRHKISPYLGAHLRGRVLETWLRGEQIYDAPGWPSAQGREWKSQ